LDFYREVKRLELKQIRAEGTVAPINNIQVGREEDRETIKGSIENWDLLVLTEGKKAWIMADNSVQLLTKAELQAVEPLYAVRKDQCFNAYGIAVEELKQASSIEDIMNVTLQIGE